MTMDWQFIIVVAAVALAGLYTGRSFLRQFSRSDDESQGCSGCPAADPRKTPDNPVT